MPRKTKQQTGNSRKTVKDSRKHQENQPEPSREVVEQQQHPDNEERANTQKSNETKILVAANQDEVIPEKYKKYYINITLEQFRDCSNIYEVLTNEIKRKNPNSKELLKLDKITKEIHQNYRLCPLYRKQPILKDLKLEPKPWLTKNDKKLLNKNEMSPCFVDMESKNIAKYIENRAIYKENKRNGYKGYNFYDFNRNIPSTFNKKVQHYGGFDIACERILEKQEMEKRLMQFITEFKPATEISNPSPKAKPIGKENTFDKVKISRPCPMSRKVKVTEVNDTNEHCELIDMGRPAPLSQMANQRGTEKKKNMTKSVRPCPMSRKPKEIPVIEEYNINEGIDLVSIERPAALLSQKQRDIENNKLDNNKKNSRKSVITRPCPMSRKPKEINEALKSTTNERPGPLSQKVKQNDIKNNVSNTLDNHFKITSKSANARPCPMSHKRKVPEVNNLNKGNDLIATDGAATLSKIENQDSIENKKLEVPRKLARRRKSKMLNYAEGSETESSEKDRSVGENSEVEKLATLMSQDLPSANNTQYHIINNDKRGNFCGRNAGALAYIDDSSSDDNQSIMKLNRNEKCPRESDENIVLSEAQHIFGYEDSRSLSSKASASSRTSNFSKFRKQILQNSVGTSTSDLGSQYNVVNDNLVNSILPNNNHILEWFDKVEIFKILKEEYPDYDDNYLNDKVNLCKKLFNNKRSITVKERRLENACKPPDKTVVSGLEQDNSVNSVAAKENDEINKNKEKSKEKVCIISHEVLKAASRPGTIFVSFNNAMEFGKHTNIKDYLEKDIRKKFPETYNKYLSKMQILINQFYKTYILGKKIWPTGLIVDTNYMHTNLLESLRRYETRKESGAGEGVEITQSIQQLPTLENVLENHQNQEKEKSLVLGNNKTSADDIEANFKTFQKQLTFEQFLNCTKISDYIKKNISNKYSTSFGYYEKEFQKLDYWPEGLELKYEGVHNFFEAQVCQQNKNILLTQSNNESGSGNSQRHNLSDDLFPSSNETIKTGSKENNIDVLPDVDQVREITTSGNETNIEGNIENNNIGIPPDVGQEIEITSTSFYSTNSSNSLENLQDNPNVTILQSSSSSIMVHPKDLNIKNLCSGKFPRNGRSCSNDDDEYLEQDIKNEILESNLRPDTFNKDIIKTEIAENISDYGDDVEIIDVTELPIVIDDTIETVEDILDEMCNIDKNIEVVSKDQDNNLIKNNNTQEPVQQDVIDGVDEILNEMLHSPEGIIIDNSQKTDFRNDVGSSNILSESNLLVSLNTDLINDLAANNILSESNRLVSPIQFIDKVNDNQDANFAAAPKGDYIPEKKKAKKIALSSNSKVPAASKSDFVPQARHNFGELEFISTAKNVTFRKRRNSCTETAAKPFKIQRTAVSQNEVNIDDPDYRIEDASGTLSHSQLLNNDNTYFTSTLILAASETSAITKTSVTNTETSVVPTTCFTSEIIPPKNINQKLHTTESNQIAVKENEQPLQGAQKRNYSINKIYRQLNSKIFVYITYLSLYEIKCDKKLNSLLYESSVPFLMPFEKQPIQSTILFQSHGFNKLNIIGDSLKLILGFNDNEWKCLLNILQVVGTFEYCINAPEPCGKSLPYRLLYLLFKSLPQFSQITLEIADSNINQAKCVKFSTKFYEPSKNLVDVFSPGILKLMAKAKNELCNNVIIN